MKTSILLLITILFPACSSNHAEKATNKMDGAWKVVSWKMIRNDSIINEFPGKITGSEMKIWSGDKFIFSGHYRIDTLLIDNYGGGSFTLENDHYTENIQYFSDNKTIGNMVKIILKMDGDTITQTWPAGENWQINKTLYNVQKLVKIK